MDGDPLQEELDLKKSGEIWSLQRHRWKLWCQQDTEVKKSADKRMRTLMVVETRLREVTQLEMSLRERLHEHLENTPAEDTSADERAAFFEELDKYLVNCWKEYWSLERAWWREKTRLPDGPLTRAIHFWRSQPSWYMHPVLVENCIGLGGCCSRQCGCCSNRENMLVGRPFAAGHCSFECHCCEVARGYKLSSDWTATYSDWPEGEVDRVHSLRIRHASLLGIEAGSLENPLDLIRNAPPRYTP